MAPQTELYGKAKRVSKEKGRPRKAFNNTERPKAKKAIPQYFEESPRVLGI